MRFALISSVSFLVVALFAAGAPAAEPVPNKRLVVNIPAQIDKLVEVADWRFGYRIAVLDGYRFLPLDRIEISYEDPLDPEPLDSLETMREIVKRGAAAVPHLIAHLGDKRATKMTTSSTDLFGDSMDRNPNTDKPEPARPTDDDDTPQHQSTPHTLTVGDLCYVALGQIVNRRFDAEVYFQLSPVIIRSPTHSPTLLAAVKRQWGTLTPERHKSALIADFLKPDSAERRIGACKRLAYYYPDALEPLALKYLSQAKIDRFERARLIREGMTFDRKVRIDRAVGELLASAGNDEALALACIERLIGRGWDAEIEKVCRSRIAVHKRLAGELRSPLDKLGWNLVHVEVERRNRDDLRDLLAAKVDVNARARNGSTPLHLAAAVGDMQIVGMLISAGAALDAKNHDGKTPVQIASQTDHLEIVRLLATKGCAVPDILTAAVIGRRERVDALLKADPSSVKATNKRKRTPLHLAARQGQEAVAKLLLDKGASVDAADAKGWTPLHWAVAAKHEAMVRLLLDRKANPSIVDRSDGYSPLHLAVRSTQVRLAELLLDRGAAVDAKDSWGRTPLLHAADNGSVQMVRVLLDRKADVKARSTGRYSDAGRQAIHFAATNGHADVVKLLLDYKADPLALDPQYGAQPLHLAAENGHIGVAKVLLAHSVPVDSRTEKLGTPLDLAAFAGHERMVRLLLEHKARVNVRNADDWQPLDGAIESGSLETVRLLLDHKANLHGVEKQSGMTPLDRAAFFGDPAIVALLLDRGAKVNGDGEGRTPLHIAASEGRVRAARVLLDRKANVRAASRATGEEPLHVAAAVDSPKMIALLLDRGAEMNAREKEHGRTALHIAVVNEWDKVVALLLRRKADCTIKDKAGLTPLAIAIKKKNTEIIPLLRAHGAKE